MLETSGSLNPRSDPASPWWHVDISPVLATTRAGHRRTLGYLQRHPRARRRELRHHVRRATDDLPGHRSGAWSSVTVFFDYRWLSATGAAGRFWPRLGLLALSVVRRRRGQRRNVSWFEFGGFRAQPSEFAKIGLIVADGGAPEPEAPSGPRRRCSSNLLTIIGGRVPVPIGLGGADSRTWVPRW